MGTLVRRWRGETWTALLTREAYGLHFSVGAEGRMPTDAEVDEAMHGYAFTLEQPLTEATAAHQAMGAINPHVRHFMPERAARRMFDLATTGGR